MRIWIDIDNSPHVPLFAPVIRELEKRGHSVFVTTREYAQTIELLEKSGIPFKKVGEHAGKSTFKKIVNVLRRAYELRKAVAAFKPDAAVSHGSRAQSIACKIGGIPKLLLFDYEWTEMQIFKRCVKTMACPDVLSDEILLKAGLPLEKITKYKGLKEEIYLPLFQPDATFRHSLKIPDDKIFVVIRPSSMTSNYHDSKSEEILKELLDKIGKSSDVTALVTPRTEVDRKFIHRYISENGISNVQIAEKALPGMQLLYWADVVVSGGGTMNREAVLLGTPTYSIFTGTRPGVDSYLEKHGLLKFIEEPEGVEKIRFLKKNFPENYNYSGHFPLNEIVQLIENIKA
jgi:predicted glycosyltransferase